MKRRVGETQVFGSLDDGARSRLGEGARFLPPGGDADTCLCALAQAGGSLRRPLEIWRAEAGVPQALQLARVIRRNTAALTRGAPLTNAFWSSRHHQATELRSWLLAHETRAQLERATLDAGSVDPALPAALAVLQRAPAP